MKQNIKDMVETAIAGPNALAAELANEVVRLDAILNTPEFHDFIKAVPLEASHQVQRWGSDHDAGKQPQDWFWLVGYLAGKALRAHVDGDEVKAKHHCISSAAALSNWHAAISGASNMRPGILPPDENDQSLATAGAGPQPTEQATTRRCQH